MTTPAGEGLTALGMMLLGGRQAGTLPSPPGGPIPQPSIDVILKTVTDTLATGLNYMYYDVAGQTNVWLLGASLTEVTSTSRGFVDYLHIDVEEKQDSTQRFPLCDGMSPTGQIGGYGAIPLKSGQRICGTTTNSVAGNIARLHLILAYIDPSVPITPNWSQREEVAFTRPYGPEDTYYLAGTAAATQLDMRPASGTEYIILDLDAYHDDPADRTLTWYMVGTTGHQINSSAGNIAANVRISIYQKIETGGTKLFNAAGYPLISTYDCYPRVTASAMAAGQKLYITGIVLINRVLVSY